MVSANLISGQGLRLAAISFSLLLHGLLFMNFGGIPATAVAQQTQSMTRMSFLAPSPEPRPVKEKQEAKEAAEKVEPQPVSKNKLKKPEKIEQKQEKAEATPETPAAQPAASAEVAQLNEGVLQKETERYLTEIMAHIEQFKWYPKAAKRRGIEGEVNVSFVLMPDGTTTQLTVESAPNVLLLAAKEAVQKASPMPKPPASIHCPLPCEFQMRFNLKAG